jgi:phytoene/squalene synthetase
VLAVLGLATPARIALSDSICTALQLVEHCQDVAEDLARGRVYLPAEDLARFGASEADLRGEHASAPLREALAFEVDRARGLLAAGTPLIAQLRGRPRLAVAAFAAGGRAALDAIERAGYDVLAAPPRAGALQRALALAATLRAARGTAP